MWCWGALEKGSCVSGTLVQGGQKYLCLCVMARVLFTVLFWFASPGLMDSFSRKIANIIPAIRSCPKIGTSNFQGQKNVRAFGEENHTVKMSHVSLSYWDNSQKLGPDQIRTVMPPPPPPRL